MLKLSSKHLEHTFVLKGGEIIINENYWTNLLNTIFLLDTTSKKGYNGINQLPNNKNVFDNASANSALDYFYSNDNLGKTESFLENNGFPSAEERQYNKEAYGVADERNMVLDLLNSKSNSILNPKLPDDTDRAFLSGLMGEEEEKLDYQNQVANDLAVASQILGAINPYHVTVDFYTTR